MEEGNKTNPIKQTNQQSKSSHGIKTSANLIKEIWYGRKKYPKPCSAYLITK